MQVWLCKIEIKMATKEEGKEDSKKNSVESSATIMKGEQEEPLAESNEVKRKREVEEQEDLEKYIDIFNRSDVSFYNHRLAIERILSDVKRNKMRADRMGATGW